MRPKHVVSTKIVLYSHDLSSILVMRYPKRNVSGLPGGHVEAHEHPDDTIRRELIEELNLSLGALNRVDFMLREGDHGPIILVYKSIAPEHVAINPSRPDIEYGEWIKKDDVKNINMSPEYIRTALENWPNQQA